jgi:hypothetical protein
MKNEVFRVGGLFLFTKPYLDILNGDRLNMKKLTLCNASGYNQENTKGN